ncbi:hypothetical protein [Brumimicrobium aurantiacum]|uniref:GIY-YIG nuclease family protein n=1 Tax=Brumimicrobium aurantiacum TaxID=1737063 RepID=A0A3E1EZL9_9FLAO|nr:hypothetical protein [Brumimicrobium aurantiacum]RFC55010.1 hypothetical protein DXU93_04090 [Brumimicrobium aurantiacum]
MDFKGPYCYTLFLSGEKDKRVLFKKDSNGHETNFKKPVTKSKTPKIYILKAKEKIVYVGYASQSIGTRLGQGIRATGKNGYHGNKWKQVSELELLVFIFDQELKGNKHDDDKPHIALAEAVEAELVFKVRKETGKWPEFQNEIHFNNVRLEKAKEIAREIYGEVSEER